MMRRMIWGREWNYNHMRCTKCFHATSVYRHCGVHQIVHSIIEGISNDRRVRGRVNRSSHNEISSQMRSKTCVHSVPRRFTDTFTFTELQLYVQLWLTHEWRRSTWLPRCADKAPDEKSVKVVECICRFCISWKSLCSPSWETDCRILGETRSEKSNANAPTIQFGIAMRRTTTATTNDTDIDTLVEATMSYDQKEY